MHETGIVRNMVRRLESIARDAGATRVSVVAVWLGALSPFSPDHFREHFDEEVRGTVVDGATLEIEQSQDLGHPNAQDVIMQSVDLDVPDTQE